MMRTGSFVTGSLLVLTVGLVLLGVTMVLSSSQFLFSQQADSSGEKEININKEDNIYKYMGKQLMWFSVGLAGLAFFYLCDYNFWERKSRWILLLACGLLLLVFTKLGVKVNGAYRWIRVFGFTIQPSDFAKFAVIIYLSSFWAERQEQLGSFLRGVLWPMIFVAMALGLIVKEPDHGTVVIIGLTAMVIWYVAGSRMLHLIPILWAFCLAILAAIYTKPVLYERILAYLHPEQYKSSKYYQVYQSLIGFAHGGWGGVGIGEGVQQLGFTPFPHTDFIFSTMGEELGFFKCSIVLIAYLFIAILGFCVAMRCTNPFGKLLSIGCAAAVSLQAALNIAVVTGSIPTTGIALPLISYGGSSLTMMMCIIGLLMSVARDTFVSEETPGRNRRIRAHGYAHG